MCVKFIYMSNLFNFQYPLNVVRVLLFIGAYNSDIVKAHSTAELWKVLMAFDFVIFSQ